MFEEENTINYDETPETTLIVIHGMLYKEIAQSDFCFATFV